YGAARRLYAESLAVSRALGDWHTVTAALEGLATMAAVTGCLVGSARIWGSAERLREQSGSPLPPIERSRYMQRVAAARASVSDNFTFDRAWEEGRAMTVDQ